MIFSEIELIEEYETEIDVFDITVDHTHNFYANGICVHNCIGGFGAYSVMEKFQGISFDNLTPDLLDNPSKMEEVQRELQNAFDPIVDAVGEENVFAELQFNKLAPQHLVNRSLIEFSKRTGIKLTAAADSHYCRPELWLEREIYKKLARMRYEDIDASMLPTSKDVLKCELYPKNSGQMWDSYKEYTGGMSFYDDLLMKEAIERTHDIAYDMIKDVKMDTSIKLPSFVIPPGQTAFEALYEACKEGMLHKGLWGKSEYKQRLKYELQIIQEKGFAQYFLLTKMIMNIAYDNMLVGAGRGSGAGSLVNYLLGITQIDPLKYGLMFERFISTARCLEKGTKVLMVDGKSKNIEDVVVGDEVETDQGSRKILDTNQSFHDEVIEIVVSDQTFTCSPNHIWPISRNGEDMFVRADELLETDEIFVREKD